MSIVGNNYQTGTADPGFYQNQLKNLVTNPSSFQGTPGFQFALNQGLNAVNRSNSAMRGSGNALAALTNYGTGLANQDYSQYLGQLGQLSGQEQNYDLGLAGVNNTAQGNANQLFLGEMNAGNQVNKNNQDFALGQGQLALGNKQANNQFTLGQGQLGLGYGQLANSAQNVANNYNLGQGQLANQAQNNWWNYSLGNAQNQNQYNLGMYNAQTNRGNAQSNAFLGGQNNALDWYRYGPQQPYWQGNTLFGGRPPISG